LDNIFSTLYIDIEEVLSELKVYYEETGQAQYNSTALTKIKVSGDNLMCCCPYEAENNPSFGILTSYPYTFQCFSCGKTGNLPQLVAHCCGFKNEVVAEHFLLKNLVMLSADQRPKLDLDDILDKRSRDRRCSHLEEEMTQFVGKRHPYMYSRGFRESTLNKYEIGYDEYSQSMVIPIRTSNGNIRFMKRRFVNRKGFLNETNLDKKDIIYGLYYIKQAKTSITEIAINESETDTMACYQGGIPAGAILGRIVFKEQVVELMKADIKVVNLFLDNDYWGVRATLQAYNTIVSNSPIRVNVVKYPCQRYGVDTLDEEEISFKDANDLLKANMIGQINRITFDEYYSELNKEFLKSIENN
jgi:DNA primase